MNSFLKPLVTELQEFWSGVMISCETHPLKNIYVCAAVICCTCDIPMTSGFVGHNAKHGCSKCLKEFISLEANGDSTKRLFRL